MQAFTEKEQEIIDTLVVDWFEFTYDFACGCFDLKEFLKIAKATVKILSKVDVSEGIPQDISDLWEDIRRFTILPAVGKESVAALCIARSFVDVESYVGPHSFREVCKPGASGKFRVFYERETFLIDIKTLDLKELLSKVDFIEGWF